MEQMENPPVDVAADAPLQTSPEVTVDPPYILGFQEPVMLDVLSIPYMEVDQNGVLLVSVRDAAFHYGKSAGAIDVADEEHPAPTGAFLMAEIQED